MVIVVALVVLLYPVGASAAGKLYAAVITDPGGTNKAHVDASGSLQVTGTVNVGNTPTVGIDPRANGVRIVGSAAQLSVTSTDDPGRQAFQADLTLDMAAGQTSREVGLKIPPGERLVIRYVSGTGGGRVTDAALSTEVNGVTVNHEFVPVTVGSQGEAIWAQDTVIYADGGTTLIFTALREDASLDLLFGMDLSGYVLDCSVAACN